MTTISPATSWEQILVAATHTVAKRLDVDPTPPTPAAFADFVTSICPTQVIEEVIQRLNALLVYAPPDILADIPNPSQPDLTIQSITAEGMLLAKSHDRDLSMSLTTLEQGRLMIPQQGRPRSLLPPLIESWLNNPMRHPVAPDTRARRILPKALTEATSTTHVLPAHVQIGQQVPPSTQYLPGFEPPPGNIIPVLPLEIASAISHGRGAPITSRLWFGCQMALSVQHRTGNPAVLALTIRDMVSWIWPNGWNRRRDMPRLIEGLRQLGTVGTWWRRTEWLLVRPAFLPAPDWHLDDHVLIEITTLPDSQRGPTIDPAVLWPLGAQASTPWRIWIRLAYLWDDAKVRNGRHRIYASRPQVRRAPDGTLIDDAGQPVLNHQGQPVTAWHDPRAIRTGALERHPHASRIPELTTHDLAHLGFDNTSISPTTVRTRAAKTRDWLERLEHDGLITLEWNRKGLRILENWTNHRNP